MGSATGIWFEKELCDALRTALEAHGDAYTVRIIALSLGVPVPDAVQGEGEWIHTMPRAGYMIDAEKE